MGFFRTLTKKEIPVNKYYESFGTVTDLNNGPPCIHFPRVPSIPPLSILLLPIQVLPACRKLQISLITMTNQTYIWPKATCKYALYFKGPDIFQTHYIW